MNVLGEIGSLCLVPIVVENHSPISLPTLAVDFDLCLMFCEIPTTLFPTPYDFQCCPSPTANNGFHMYLYSTVNNNKLSESPSALLLSLLPFLSAVSLDQQSLC